MGVGFESWEDVSKSSNCADLNFSMRGWYGSAHFGELRDVRFVSVELVWDPIRINASDVLLLGGNRAFHA